MKYQLHIQLPTLGRKAGSLFYGSAPLVFLFISKYTEKRTKPSEYANLIFFLFPSFSKTDPLHLTNIHEKKKDGKNYFSKHK